MMRVIALPAAVIDAGSANFGVEGVSCATAVLPKETATAAVQKTSWSVWIMISLSIVAEA